MELSPQTNIKPNRRPLFLMVAYLLIDTVLNNVLYLFYRTHFPDWIRLAYYISTYLILAILIREEKDRLGDFHMDKSAVIIFIVFGAFLRITTISSRTLLCLGNLAFVLIGIWLIVTLRKSKIQLVRGQEVGKWTLIGLLFSVVLLGYIVLVIVQMSPSPEPKFYLLTLYRIASYLIYHLGNAAVSEEPGIRGFLWGYLRRLGYDERRILVFQAIIFMFGHTYVIIEKPTFLGFWILLPIVGLIWGFLAWKSRSITPGLISHGLHNALFDVVRLYFKHG